MSGLLIRLGMLLGWFYAPEVVKSTTVTQAFQPGSLSTLALLLSIFFTLNLVLLTFNLLPLPPLDGSGAVPLFLSASAADRYQQFSRHPQMMLPGLLAAWWLFRYIFDPLHTLALNLLYPEFGYS